MSNKKAPEIEQIRFFQFVFTNKWNIIYLILAFSITLVIWLLFKNFYPNPNIIFDSYHYLNATTTRANVNAWPIGYSWFLRFVGQFSHSANFLVTVQYVLLNLSLLLFFFTLRFFFYLPIWSSSLLLMFLLFNPIFVFTSNLILSDTIFTTLSIFWLTNIIWIIIKPKYWMIFSHAIILVIAFSVRYNALYYPIISIIAFLFVKRNAVYKISAITLQLSLIGAFISFTVKTMDLTFGVKQFSTFGGWKLANDALYMYKHVYNQNVSNVPKELLSLDCHVKKYFSTNRDTIDLFTPDPTSGSFYMYIHPSPLLTYRDLIYGSDNSSLNLNTFSKLGPLYQEYGKWLICNNPKAFSRYFIWPNIQRYFISPPEVYVDNYNPFSIRMDSLGMSARKWFNINSIFSKQSSINFRYNIFINYPILNITIHIIFLFGFISIILSGYLRYLDRSIILVIILVGIMWLLDFIFNIIAAAIVLRYQIFISIVEFSFSIIFINRMIDDNSVMRKRYKSNVNLLI